MDIYGATRRVSIIIIQVHLSPKLWRMEFFAFLHYLKLPNKAAQVTWLLTNETADVQMAGKKNGEPLQGLGTITENEKDSRVRYMPRPFERPLFLALQPPFLPGVHHQGHIFQQAPQLPTLQRTHIQKVLTRPTKVAYVCSSTWSFAVRSVCFVHVHLGIQEHSREHSSCRDCWQREGAGRCSDEG